MVSDTGLSVAEVALQESRSSTLLSYQVAGTCKNAEGGESFPHPCLSIGSFGSHTNRINSLCNYTQEIVLLNFYFPHILPA